jgi:serine/threonine protein kinase
MLTRITPLNRGKHTELLPDDLLPFRHIENLGVGSSAIVEVVEENHSGLKFAHKIFMRRNGSTQKTFNQAFKNEVNIMKRLHSHPHIVQIYWSYTRGRHAGMLLTPIASNGDLAAYLDTIPGNGEASNIRAVFYSKPLFWLSCKWPRLHPQIVHSTQRYQTTKYTSSRRPDDLYRLRNCI